MKTRDHLIIKVLILYNKKTIFHLKIIVLYY